MDDTTSAETGDPVFASEQLRPKRKSPRPTFVQVRAGERVRVAGFLEAMAQRLVDGPSPEADAIYRQNAHDAVSAGVLAAMLRGAAGSIRADICDPHPLWPATVDMALPL